MRTKVPGESQHFVRICFCQVEYLTRLGKKTSFANFCRGEVRYLINIIAYARKACNSFDDHFCKTLTTTRGKVRPDLFYY